MSFQFTVFQKSFLFLIILIIFIIMLLFCIGARTQVKCAILVHF